MKLIENIGKFLIEILSNFGKFILFILFFFISPVEEVNAFYGLIIGVAYNLIFMKEDIYANT